LWFKAQRHQLASRRRTLRRRARLQGPRFRVGLFNNRRFRNAGGPRVSAPGQFLLYTAPDGAVKVDVFFRDENVWLTQKALAELFGVKVPAINKHLKNIYESGELTREATISKMEISRLEGSRTVAREVEFYNLDAIIAVGYRVNSYQATQFRIWATRTLREFITKGFGLDDERLKQGKQVFGKDYFDELLERIREIRASERRFYQKITDLYALEAKLKAEGEYEVYRQRQDAEYISDFDREIKRLEGNKA